MVQSHVFNNMSPEDRTAFCAHAFALCRKRGLPLNTPEPAKRPVKIFQIMSNKGFSTQSIGFLCNSQPDVVITGEDEFHAIVNVAQ